MFKILNDYKEYLLLILLLIISLILLSQNNHPNIRKVRKLAFGTFAYVNSTLNSISDFFDDDSELKKAKELNAKLMLQLNLLREYGLENFELKSLLAYKERSDFQLVTAKVISRLTSRTEGSLIINRGKKDSLSTGMVVINEEGLIGLITDVTEDFSLVRTINNTNLKVTVSNQRSRVNGIVSWDGQKMVMKNIPTTYDFQIGDRVITSDLSTVYPPSIPVGIVVEKETDISGLLGNIIVKPFADPDKATYLFVIKLVMSKQIDDLELNLFKEKR